VDSIRLEAFGDEAAGDRADRPLVIHQLLLGNEDGGGAVQATLHKDGRDGRDCSLEGVFFATPPLAPASVLVPRNWPVAAL